MAEGFFARNVAEDPMCVTSVRLLSFDLFSLQRPNPRPGGGASSSDLFWRRGRPVKKVEIVGVVVSRERKEKFLKFELDDGSGCIPCILWLNHMTDSYYSRLDNTHLQSMFAVAANQAEQVQLGRLLRVQGRLTLYNQKLQVTASHVISEKDPNAEVLHWLDCVRLSLNCYDLPSPLPSRPR